ncbi:MAG TPA: FAD-binding protein, partial [bacterium]|nr:FAD-binding protein [bacterium]
LASEAGARLRDMEFIQFHPTGLYPRGVLISEACRAEGGYLVNRDGKRFMFDYDARGELATRDIVSRGIQTEIDANRGMERKNYVGLDVRHLGREVLEHKLPIAVELARDLGGIDLAKQILPVAPTAHYFMGGIAASCNCEVYEQKRNNSKKNFAETKSVIPGLFAAGECACLSVHGANRLGCNSLLDAVVYGKRSGEQSAAYARTVNYQPIAGSQLREFAAVVDGERHRNAQGRSSGQIRADLQQGMTERCGIFRSKRRLNEQIQAIQTLQSELETVRVSYKDGWAQTVVEKKELATMLAVALLVVESALAREGSVGAHWRVDTK